MSNFIRSVYFEQKLIKMDISPKYEKMPKNSIKYQIMMDPISNLKIFLTNSLNELNKISFTVFNSVHIPCIIHILFEKKDGYDFQWVSHSNYPHTSTMDPTVFKRCNYER